MKLIGKQTLALAGGGLFALAVAVSAAQAATAAGIGTPTSGHARTAPDGAGSVAHRGIGGLKGLSAAATYIGITEAALRAELEAGKSLAEVAVANGKTRDGLVAALTAAAGEAIGDLVDRKDLGAGRPGGHGKPGHVALIRSEPHAAAAAYLGISREDLMTRVRAGETLAAIANATAGKSRDGLVAAIVADGTANIDAAVAAGKVTAEQATRMKAALAEHTARLVDSSRPAGPRGRP